MQAPSGEFLHKLNSLGEAVEQYGRKLQQLGEQQANLRESLREIGEALGAAGAPRRNVGLSVISTRDARPAGGSAVGAQPALQAAGGGRSPMAAFFGGEGKQVIRRAIADGTVSTGIQGLADLLKQIQEFLENFLKIIETVRQNLEAPSTQAVTGGLPGLSKDTVEVMTKMIRMPEFQRLMAGMLTQALRD